MRRGTSKKQLWLLSLAVLAAAIGGLFFAMNASAGGSDDLSVESAEVAPGDRGTVTVMAEINSSPGLGAWTVDVVVENPDQVSIIDCDAPGGSVCNPDYPGDLPTVRFAGASATGLIGDIELGTITFECADTEGSSVLSLLTTGFADATVGGPVEIPVTHTNGTIRCEEAASPTRRPRATPTTEVTGMPDTGFGDSGGGTSGWLFAALAGAGLATVAGVGALRARRR